MENSELVRIILLLGSIAGAIAAIVALIVKLARVIKKIVDFFKKLSTSVDTLVRHDKEQYLSILRITVMEEQMPLSERVAAAKKYIDAGGNGDVKQYYEEHLKPLDKIEGGQRNGIQQ